MKSPGGQPLRLDAAMAKERQCVMFQSSDGQRFQVDDDLIGMCPTAKHVLSGRRTSFRNALGGSTFAIEGSHVLLKREGRVLATLLSDSPEEVVVSFPEVRSEALGRVIDYCWHTLEITRGADVEKRQWDAIFMQLDQGALCELASAAYYLDVKPLVNLTSRIIASKISGKTTEELRETLCEMSFSGDGDRGDSSYSTRYRLQRKLARNQTPPADVIAEASRRNAEDSRTVDELLSFIDGSAAGSASEAKRQKRKLKKQQKKVTDTAQDSDTSASAAPDETTPRSQSPRPPDSPQQQTCTDTVNKTTAGPRSATKAPSADAYATSERVDAEGKFTNHMRTSTDTDFTTEAKAYDTMRQVRTNSSDRQAGAKDRKTLPVSSLVPTKKAPSSPGKAHTVPSASEVCAMSGLAALLCHSYVAR